MLGEWQVQKGQKINTWARHIQTAKQQKQNLGSTANIPQLQERGMRGTWDVSSETTPVREESDSMCACVYKAVIVLMDSVVEFRKGVSEMTFFSTMSERIACWERCSHGSRVFCRCLHVCLAPELARYGRLAQLRSYLSSGLGSRHEGLREISLLGRGLDVNSERPICGAEAGARSTPACLDTVLGACVLAAH